MGLLTQAHFHLILAFKDSMKNEYLEIGEIVRPQGVRGEVKLRQESQDESRYARLETVWLKQGDSYLPRRVRKGRASGGFAYLSLEGVDDRDAAEALRGVRVYVDRAHALKLPEGEHFICDLIGLTAVTDAGREIGVLRDVITGSPSCDTYVFDTPRGEMMMPALRRVIRSVDVDAGVMVLDGEALGEVAFWQDGETETV